MHLETGRVRERISQKAAFDMHGTVMVADDLLGRYSLVALASVAGLKNSVPLERVLRSPRIGARLAKFLVRKMELTPGAVSSVRLTLLNTQSAELNALIEALGLCWGLARLQVALTPEDMQGLRVKFASRVLALAHAGLPFAKISPAVSMPSGIDWLSQVSCVAFGRAAFLGWLESSDPDSIVAISHHLGIDLATCKPRRAEGLDGMIEALLPQLTENAS